MKHLSLTRLVLPAAVLAASIAPVPAISQAPSNVTVYATGLQGPRGLKFGPDGLLYVAEAGTGGTTSTQGICTQVVPPIGPYFGGSNGRISRIDSSGNRTTVASGLPSAIDSNAPNNDYLGVADVAFLDGTLYAAVTGGGCSHGNASAPNSVVKVAPDGSWKVLANLSQFFLANPTQYPNADDFEPDGVPYSMIAYQNRLYLVESNRGQVVSIGRTGDIRREIDVSASQGHIVPTTIAESGGNFYLGNLNLFPILPTAARIQTLSYSQSFLGSLLSWLDPASTSSQTLKIVDSKAGFTTVVSSAFGPDGLLYVLELSAAAGYPTPGDGKVVRIARNGDIQDVATGLVVPTGMTFGPDGKIYVSNLGAAPPGAGQIVRIDLP
jgi:hypothetical protein